jgi:hypothetical protein
LQSKYQIAQEAFESPSLSKGLNLSNSNQLSEVAALSLIFGKHIQHRQRLETSYVGPTHGNYLKNMPYSQFLNFGPHGNLGIDLRKASYHQDIS